MLWTVREAFHVLQTPLRKTEACGFDALGSAALNPVTDGMAIALLISSGAFCRTYGA